MLTTTVTRTRVTGIIVKVSCFSEFVTTSQFIIPRYRPILNDDDRSQRGTTDFK